LQLPWKAQLQLKNITLLLNISCCMWNTESRKFSSVLSVPNGGSWGEWGPASFCSYGYANGFSLKVKVYFSDAPLLLNILLCLCIIAFFGRWRTWTRKRLCPGGYLVTFSMRVEPHQKILDDTAVNNIGFKCSGGANLIGFGTKWGKFGPWSDRCSIGICGMKTRVEDAQGISDDTALNDVAFYCC
uniref:Vitelline membrane outer layer protein 1 n=1 Tax=Laticauda laticaudata TaxID=8630 RepID=A0A8C5SLT1_LATLA